MLDVTGRPDPQEGQQIDSRGDTSMPYNEPKFSQRRNLAILIGGLVVAWLFAAVMVYVMVDAASGGYGVR